MAKQRSGQSRTTSEGPPPDTIPMAPLDESTEDHPQAQHSAEDIAAALELKRLFDELEIDPAVVVFLVYGLREWIEAPQAKTEVRAALNYGGPMLAEKVCLFFMDGMVTDRQRQIGRLLSMKMDAIRAYARVNAARIPGEVRQLGPLTRKSETARAMMLRLAESDDEAVEEMRQRVAEAHVGLTVRMARAA